MPKMYNQRSLQFNQTLNIQANVCKCLTNKKILHKQPPKNNRKIFKRNVSLDAHLVAESDEDCRMQCKRPRPKVTLTTY